MKAECILLVPKNGTDDDNMRALARIQYAWTHLCGWLENKSNKTFDAVKEVRLMPVNADITINNDGLWRRIGVISDELDNKESKKHRIFVAKGAGGFAGGVGDPWNYAAVGDAALEEIMELTRPTACDILVKGDKWQCSWGGQVGALLHELGHTYNLTHEDGGFMYHYKTYPVDVEIPPKALQVMFITTTVPWWSRFLSWIIGLFR